MASGRYRPSGPASANATLTASSLAVAPVAHVRCLANAASHGLDGWSAVIARKAVAQASTGARVHVGSLATYAGTAITAVLSHVAARSMPQAEAHAS